jgi:peptide/nickel transport system permease protein
MANEPAVSLEEIRPPVNEWRRIMKVMSSRWVTVFILTAIFAPLLAPYGPNDLGLTSFLQQPSRAHLLGTDNLGRDTLSRLIYGSRISILVGFVSVTIAFAAGMSLGLFAGYFRGLQTIIMRFIDALMAIPPLILVLALATVLGGGLRSVLIAVGIGFVPTYARLMCGQILSIKESDFIKAATAMGASDLRIMGRHLLPNTLPVLLVAMTMNLGIAILIEASLSFLGIGINPPTATWGSMVSEGYRYLTSNPVLSFAPGLSIMLVVLAFNMVGDGLRDALDPRLRGTL